MDDYFLAVGSADDTLRTLNGPAFDVATTRLASGGDVDAVAFSPDGRYLAVGHRLGAGVTIIDTTDWLVASGTPGLGSNVSAVAWSPDGSYLALTLGHGVTVISAVDWSVVSSAPDLGGNALDCAWSPDGAYLAVALGGAPYLAVLDTSDWSDIGEAAYQDLSRGCAWSPDGAYLAVVGHADLVVLSTSDWSVVSATPSIDPIGYGCAWSPDGSYLAVAHSEEYRDDYCLTVIKVVDWSVVSEVPRLRGDALDCAWSPDGAYLAVARSNYGSGIVILDAERWSVMSGVANTGDGLSCAWLPNINRPTRHGILYDHDGNPLSLPVQLLRRPAWARSQVVTPDPVSGAFTVRGFAPGDYHLLIPDTRPGATDDRLLRITLDETTGALAPLEVYMPYAGALTTISGNATKAIDGSAADDVIVRAWGSHGHVIDVVPAPSGDWSAEVPPGTYDITYRSAGCQPVCHGPYTIVAPEGED